MKINEIGTLTGVKSYQRSSADAVCEIYIINGRSAPGAGALAELAFQTAERYQSPLTSDPNTLVAALTTINGGAAIRRKGRINTCGE